MPTPAALATSSSDVSTPRSANSTVAVSSSRARLRAASARSGLLSSGDIRVTTLHKRSRPPYSSRSGELLRFHPSLHSEGSSVSSTTIDPPAGKESPHELPLRHGHARPDLADPRRRPHHPDDDRPRLGDREHRAAGHAAGPAHPAREPVLGRQRLHPRLRRPAPARRQRR